MGLEVAHHISRSHGNDIGGCWDLADRTIVAKNDVCESVLSHQAILPSTVTSHCRGRSPHLEADAVGAILIVSIGKHVGHPCSDVATAVELVAGDDYLGTISIVNSSTSILVIFKWRELITSVCWP